MRRDDSDWDSLIIAKLAKLFRSAFSLILSCSQSRC